MRAPRSLVSFVAVVALAASCSTGADPDPTVATDGSTGTASTEDSPTTPATITPTTTTPDSAETTPTTGSLPPLQGLAYVEVGSARFPIAMIPDGDRTLLAERAGVVTVFGSGDVVLDLSDATRTDGERGLLGMALGPDSGDLFVHYSGTDGDTVVARFARNGSGFDRSSETVLLRVGQPAANHNGGMIQFDPRGRLLLGLGDGGAANDRFGNGQDFDTLLGGLVSIDPQSGEAELIAGGLRNPWRFWIDDVTNTIAIADVGQNRLEEVSIVELDGTFRNFGWPIMEGTECFSPESGCDRSGLTLPVLDIEHGDEGTCSITGGITYRGAEIPELAGQFFFSDLCGGWLRSVAVTEPHQVTDWTPDVGSAGQVVSFGLDADGEMHVLTTSAIFEIVPIR